MITPTKIYEYESTSKDLKELFFPSPESIVTTPKRQLIRDIINIPSPKVKMSHDDTPRKKKLRTQLRRQSKLLRNKRSHIIKLRQNLNKFKHNNSITNLIKSFPFSSNNSRAIVTMQLNQSRRQWSVEEKKLALTLFYKSPAAYNFLILQKVNLPSPSTVRRWIGQSNFLPGLNKIFLSHLNRKFEFKTKKEKKCVICFDEISIKECIEYSKQYDFVEGFEDFVHLGRTGNVANSVLVFMARGIYAPWKIPIAYYLARSAVKHDVLKQLVENVLISLFETGLCPKIITCDQGTYNQSALKSLGVTKNKPYFFIDDTKIYALFDVPHLLKSVRNNLIGCCFLKGDKKISFIDIKDTYDVDKIN